MALRLQSGFIGKRAARNRLSVLEGMDGRDLPPDMSVLESKCVPVFISFHTPDSKWEGMDGPPSRLSVLEGMDGRDLPPDCLFWKEGMIVCSGRNGWTGPPSRLSVNVIPPPPHS